MTIFHLEYEGWWVLCSLVRDLNNQADTQPSRRCAYITLYILVWLDHNWDVPFCSEGFLHHIISSQCLSFQQYFSDTFHRKKACSIDLSVQHVHSLAIHVIRALTAFGWDLPSLGRRGLFEQGPWSSRWLTSFTTPRRGKFWFDALTFVVCCEFVCSYVFLGEHWQPAHSITVDCWGCILLNCAFFCFRLYLRKDSFNNSSLLPLFHV